MAKVIEDVHSRYARFIVEQATIGGAFDPKLLLSAEQANTVAAEIAKRLDTLAEETERGWTLWSAVALPPFVHGGALN